jgi:hypothetical protein
MANQDSKYDHINQMTDIVYALHGLKAAVGYPDEGLDSMGAHGLLQLIKMIIEKAETLQEALTERDEFFNERAME